MDAPTEVPPPTGAARPGLPPPPGGRPGPRRLRRRPDDGPLAGVCAGVAEYFDVDPVLIRIATVVLFFSGPGFFAYVLAWIFIPAADEATDTSVGRPSSRDRTSQVFGVLLVLVSLTILWDGWWGPGRRWLVPLGLMGLGAWLLLRPDRDDSWEPTPTASTLEPEPVRPVDDDTTIARSELGDPTAVAPAPPWAPPEPSPVPPPARSRRVLGPMVFGALLIWGGAAALTGVSLGTALAVSLLLLGGGFVVGAFIGGSRALVIPAFLIAVGLALTTAVDIPLNGPIGEHGWTPDRVSALADPFEVSMGQGTLDLTGVPLRPGAHVEVEASVGMGHLVVLVPDGAEVVTATQVGAGEARVFDDVQSGVGFTTDHVRPGDAGAATIELDLQVGLGQIEVRRAADGATSPMVATTTTLG